MSSQSNLFSDFLSVLNPFLKNEGSWLLAVSGGVDSMVLLHLFGQIARKQPDLKIGVFHFNHLTRPGENEAEADVVIQTAKALGFHIYIETWTDKPKKLENFQHGAREARYQTLSKVAADNHYQTIVTAHHLDDQYETILQRLFSGRDPALLEGIPFHREAFIRPLLTFKKSELIEYAKQHSVIYLEDSSNASTGYDRNWLRHELIPLLDHRFNDRWRTGLSHLSGHFSFFNQWVMENYHQRFEMIENQKAAGHFIQRSFFEGPVLLNQHLLRFFLSDQYHHFIGNDQLEALFFKMMTGQTGLNIRISDTLSVRIERKGFRFQPSVFESQQWIVEVEKVENPQRIKGDNSIVFLDGDQIIYPLSVRYWSEGDRFHPLGMPGEIKVSDFLINRKIEVNEKKQIPLILDGSGKIIWIYKLEIADFVKITDQTTTILKLNLELVNANH